MIVVCFIILDSGQLIVLLIPSVARAVVFSLKVASFDLLNRSYKYD
jgi:hypothetical protein